MDETRRYDWEKPIDVDKLKPEKDYDLKKIYDRAHAELSLQQSKRDQIISLYLALCSFLLPFALGSTIQLTEMKGLIFVVVGVVGVIFSFITMRYREYKEIYWLCCQSITVMLSFKPEQLDKATVQRAFYYCMQKKGKGLLVDKKGESIINKWMYSTKNIFSAETLHFAIIALMASFITALGIVLILSAFPIINLIAGIAVGVILFFVLLERFFATCIKIYGALEKRAGKDDDDRRNKAFKKAFSKAWFLHFYYDE